MYNRTPLWCALALGFSVSATSQAGLFLIDLAGTGANSSGAAEGWDAVDNLEQDVPYALTDRSSLGDDDVTLTAVDDSFDPNNTAPPGVGAEYDGIAVPAEARDDYLFKRDDTAGTTARLKIENLDPGVYNLTLFEGRTSDPSQFAKVWVGDADGRGEPAEENTGNFAQDHTTLQVTVGEGETLWYQHLEDNTGGISGFIIRGVIVGSGAPVFRRGDCNADGEVDTTDALCTLTTLFVGGDVPCRAALNVNGDELVDISDPIALLTHLFLGGPAPVAPFPGCGSGELPADDTLGCEDPPADCE